MNGTWPCQLSHVYWLQVYILSYISLPVPIKSSHDHGPSSRQRLEKIRTRISSKQVWRKSYIQGQVSLKKRRHFSLELCATHMIHLVVEYLLTLTALASFFSNTRSTSFFFSKTPTQPHASLSQPQPSFSEQTQTGKRSCEAKSTAATCSSRQSHRTTGQPFSLSPPTPQTRVST